MARIFPSTRREDAPRSGLASAFPDADPDSRKTTGRSGRIYTRYVGMMKLVLPVIAGLLAVVVVVWPEYYDEPSTFRLGVSNVTVKESEGQKLVNARYTGVDSRNRSYTVTAEAILQGLSEDDLVDLSEPKADVTVEDGSWLAMTAPTGQYSKKSEVLELAGGVNMFHDQGYEFRTERALVDFRYTSAFGDTPVQGQGPFGRLSSEGFLVLDGGARILFTGKARLIVNPGAGRPDK